MTDALVAPPQLQPIGGHKEDGLGCLPYHLDHLKGVPMPKYKGKREARTLGCWQKY